MGRGVQHSIKREDAEQLIRFLCWRSRVPEPSSVAWLTRAVRGCYKTPIPRRLPRGQIVVGPRVRDGLAAVIHETAHHVVSMRQPRLTVAEWRRQNSWRNGPRIHHGPVFIETLRELAQAWYGDAKFYPWETEYRSLRAAGAGV